MRAARRRWATGVAVVTTSTAAATTRFRGATVSAFAAVSLEPPLVLVCLEQRRRHGELVAGRRRLRRLDPRTGRTSSRPTASPGYGPLPDGRFTGIPHYDLAATGCPVLRGALAWFDCRVLSAQEAATISRHRRGGRGRSRRRHRRPAAQLRRRLPPDRGSVTREAGRGTGGRRRNTTGGTERTVRDRPRNRTGGWRTADRTVGAGQPGWERVGGRRLGERRPRQPLSLPARRAARGGAGAAAALLPGGHAARYAELLHAPHENSYYVPRRAAGRLPGRADPGRRGRNDLARRAVPGPPAESLVR